MGPWSGVSDRSSETCLTDESGEPDWRQANLTVGARTYLTNGLRRRPSSTPTYAVADPGVRS